VMTIRSGYVFVLQYSYYSIRTTDHWDNLGVTIEQFPGGIICSSDEREFKESKNSYMIGVCL